MQSEDIKKVRVVFPQIKLTISDLSYLRNLVLNSGCYGSNKTTDKLVFLGLIEYTDIPPCSKEMEKYKESLENCLNTIREELDSGEPLDIHTIAKAGYQLYFLREPKSKKGYVITESGKQLLQEGILETNISKKGCV